jgi:hypothetical protein
LVDLNIRLSESSAAEAKQKAMSQFEEDISAWVGDLGTVDKLSESYKLIDSMPKSAKLVQDIVTFCGFLVKAFLGLLHSMTQLTPEIIATWKQSSDFVKALAASAEVKDSPKWAEQEFLALLDGFEVAGRVKAAKGALLLHKGCKVDVPSELNDVSLSVSAFFDAKAAWEQKAKVLDTRRCPHAQAMTKFMSDLLGENSEEGTITEACLKGITVEVSRCRDRLVQVAGGRDDGKLWKEGVPSDSSLDSEAMVKPLKTLRLAYVDALEKRLAALQKA